MEIEWRRSGTSEPQNEPAEGAVAKDDAQHDANPFTGVVDFVTVVVEHCRTSDKALVCQIAFVHAGAAVARAVGGRAREAS